MAAEALLLEQFRNNPHVTQGMACVLPAVQRGEVTPRAGAEQAVSLFCESERRGERAE